ncbi:MAG TPA: rod shape-determining protein MreD [Vicinamibacterales bacterium]|nr:rod shape-determining protein MreD [Vicinamibacterales bacterium]
MRLAWVLVTVLVAVVLQVTLARFTVGGRWVFDLVLVGVVYAALLWGPVAGMLAGTIGGLLQDWLATSLGGGLAKTLVGFAAGVVGTQFVIVRPRARMVVVAGATVVHRLLIVALLAIIDSSQQPTWHWTGVPWTAIVAETLMNSIAGLIAFQAGEVLPGVLARGRSSRRSSLSRRNW